MKYLFKLLFNKKPSMWQQNKKKIYIYIYIFIYLFIYLFIYRLQDRPCEPLGIHQCATGTHEVHTGWLPGAAATRIASLSSLVTHEATGRACSQSPLCGEETASGLALLCLSMWLYHKEALSAAMTGVSKACCLMALVLSGNGMLCDAVHSMMAKSTVPFT